MVCDASVLVELVTARLRLGDRGDDVSLLVPEHAVAEAAQVPLLTRDARLARASGVRCEVVLVA